MSTVEAPRKSLGCSLGTDLITAGRPRALGNTKILPFGDSITAGYTDNPSWTVPFTYGYREHLLTSLNGAWPGVFSYVGGSLEPWNNFSGDPTTNPSTSYSLVGLGQDNHRGHGGGGAGYVLTEIEHWISIDDPDIVLLMYGINDIPAGSDYDPTTDKSNLLSVLNAIHSSSPDVHVILAQIFEPSTPTPSIIMFNDYIVTLVPSLKASGHNISMVDQRAPIMNGANETSSALFSNGVNHPTPEGYARMAAVWFSGISAVVAEWQAASE